jgi:hypothetical protein
MIFSVDVEEAFDKIQHPSIIKTQQIRCRRRFLEEIKPIYD